MFWLALALLLVSLFLGMKVLAIVAGFVVAFYIIRLVISLVATIIFFQSIRDD